MRRPSIPGVGDREYVSRGRWGGGEMKQCGGGQRAVEDGREIRATAFNLELQERGIESATNGVH